ncbi:MAG: restriction endonuclease subunit S [Kiritimatiellae bacterium]|nr:restriction endonuclease subunit S [Kiritimatiellia bacterium]
MGDLAAKNAKSAKGEGVLTQRRREAESAETAWPMVRLGDVCEEICRVKSLSPQPDEIEYIDISSVDRVSKRVETTTRHTRETMPGRAQQLVEMGDVLISTVRPNLNAVAIIERKHNDYPLVASTGFCVVRPKNVLLSEFLYWYSQSSDFIEPLVAVSEKASYPSVTDKIVKDLTIPLPPLSVQREIVERLEKELGEAEKVAAGFRRIAENAEAEFKAELDETFKALEDDVSRGGAETRRVRLGDVCEIQRGGSPRPIKKFITTADDGLNWIKIGDVAADGKYIVKVEEKIKPSGLNKTRQVKVGDFLLSNSMSFGRPYILKIEGCIHDGWLVLKGFQEKFTEDYFYYLLRSSAVQAQFDTMAHGSSVRNLNTRAVSMVDVTEIPLSAQHTIVTRLDAARERCDKIKAEAEKGLGAAENLRKAILKEAFEQ